LVLDASALLALLYLEPGREVVEEAIPGALISTVNLSEIAAKLADKGMPESVVEETLSNIEVEIRPFDSAAAVQAVMLRPLTRDLGLSFGDRASIALGMQLSLPVLTADRNWSDLDLAVEVRQIR
jgi:PIN domain nuclease of toxin-antitoxin system